MANPFTDHPRAVGETYGEHFRYASGFGVTMIAGGLACLTHAVFPFLFDKTGSTAVRRLYDKLHCTQARCDRTEQQIAEDGIGHATPTPIQPARAAE
jgi:hypothetical protein